MPTSIVSVNHKSPSKYSVSHSLGSASNWSDNEMVRSNESNPFERSPTNVSDAPHTTNFWPSGDKASPWMWSNFTFSDPRRQSCDRDRCDECGHSTFLMFTNGIALKNKIELDSAQTIRPLMSASMKCRSAQVLLGWLVDKEGSTPILRLLALAALVGSNDGMSPKPLRFNGAPQRKSRLGFPSSWNEMTGGSLKKVEKSKVRVLLVNDLFNKSRIVSFHIDTFASLTRSCKDSMHSAGKLLNTIFAGLINSCGIDFSITSDSSWRA